VHRVAVLAYDGVVPFDLSVPLEVFGRARLADGRPAYDVRVCACAGEVDAGLITIRTPHGLDAAVQADTVVIPGIADIDEPVPAVLIDAITAAHGRVVAICTGAFALAATGLLDGRRATTHWAAAAELARRHPAVEVDPDVLFVDEGRVLTSAGAAAGLDLCLHIVRRDHGADIANRVARRMVVAPHRDGGQAQFIEQPVPPAGNGDPIGAAIAHALDRLAEPLDVDSLARVAHLSPRQFSRRFRAATGTSPGRWLIEQRINASLPLLERDERGIELVGHAVGFPSPASYRRHFRAIVGVSPAAYRTRFRAAP
jgi:transcriptional regulator GlxA family with amidase domain